MENLATLPFELRNKIFRYYFKVEGGYAFNGNTEKLTTIDGSPVDLSLMYTCRSIANDTKHIPLAINTINISTVYREDWRELAGCFNYVSAFHRLLEQDLVVRLAQFMTPDMYSQLDLKFPTYASQIQKKSSDYEEGKTLHAEVLAMEDDESDMSYPEPFGNIRQGYGEGDAFPWREDQLRMGFPRLDYYDPFGQLADTDYGHPLRSKWDGGFWATQEALSYCLRLLAEKEPNEFTKLVYEALPGWAETYPAREFLDLAFKPWAIPSRSEVATATSRLEGDEAWKLLKPWYYATLHADRWHLWAHVSSLKSTGPRCREKIRFSAAAVAIRFLERLPVGQRLQIQNVVLHEDLPSVGGPSAHVQGLAPFFKENPRLRVERRVSLLRCIAGHIDTPEFAASFLEDPNNVKFEGKSSIRTHHLASLLAEWLLDALAVPDVGIPTEAFTFVLDGGSDIEFCADLFQRTIHRDIAWYKAYKVFIASGLLSFIYPIDSPRLRLIDKGFEEALEHLMNQTSVLRCNFDTGHPWNVHNLAEENKHLKDCTEWLVKWVLREPRMVELPPALHYAKTLADKYEIQIEDEHLC